MLKGWTCLDPAISSWDVLCCGDCQSSNLECPFRSFKVLLILFDDSIGSFLGTMFLANLLEYLSGRWKELSSNASVFGMEGHKTSSPEAGFVLSPWPRGPLISPVMGLGLLQVISTLPNLAAEECLGWDIHTLPSRVGCFITAGPVKVPSPHPLTLPNALCLFGFFSLYKYSKRLFGNHGLSWADVDDIKHTCNFHFPDSPLKMRTQSLSIIWGVCMCVCRLANKVIFIQVPFLLVHILSRLRRDLT